MATPTISEFSLAWNDDADLPIDPFFLAHDAKLEPANQTFHRRPSIDQIVVQDGNVVFDSRDIEDSQPWRHCTWRFYDALDWEHGPANMAQLVISSLDCMASGEPVYLDMFDGLDSPFDFDSIWLDVDAETIYVRDGDSHERELDLFDVPDRESFDALIAAIAHHVSNR